jgi:hypothetical protein
MTTDPLRRQLEAAQALYGGTLADYTVLTDDPYRFDTPANHVWGEWFGDLIGKRTIHCRGSHYIAIGTTKPNRKKYSNTEKDYGWIEEASAAARWLKYVELDQITDERNAAPEFVEFSQPQPEATVEIGGIEFWLPEHLWPRAHVEDFRGVQQYHLAFYGEKSSLRPLLGALSPEYEADLCLPTGDSSNTMIHRLADRSVEQGRRLIVFYFSDCDLYGYNMGVGVARKLQAYKTGWFPDLDFEVRPVALLPQQVRDLKGKGLELPSEPYKLTIDPKTGKAKNDKRIKEWERTFGIKQTEIDALATLQPDVLEEIAREAIEPFFDRTLARRVEKARNDWEKEAQARIEAAIGSETLEWIEAEAERRIHQLQLEAKAVNDLLHVELPRDFDWKVPEPPTANPPANRGGLALPLIDSDQDWIEQTWRLIAYKDYRALAHCEICGALIRPSKTTCKPECVRESLRRRAAR